MLFNLFKKKEKSNLRFHQVYVKVKKAKTLYKGQFLKIEADVNFNSGEANYYFYAFDDGIVTNKISKEHIKYCEIYNYGLVRNITDDTAEVLIICSDGYLQRYNYSSNKVFKNGDAFVINNGELIDDGKVVGQITDKRYEPTIKIVLNGIDKDKLIVFIAK